MPQHLLKNRNPAKKRDIESCNSSNPFARPVLDDYLSSESDPLEPIGEELGEIPEEIPEEYDDGHQDKFNQAFAEKVDIVWVVDDSGSMQNNLEDIQANAPTFTNILETAAANGTDFRLIVIETSATYPDCPDIGGRPVNLALSSVCSSCTGCGDITDGILTPDTWEFFGTCVEEIEGNCSNEEGIEAASRALNPDFFGGLNSNFRRSDANLEIIFVSDEENSVNVSGWTVGEATEDGLGNSINVTNAMITELTSELSTTSQPRQRDGNEQYFPLIQNHYDFFNGLISGNTHFRAHAIVGIAGVSDCDPLSDGNHYIALSDLSGGTTTDICGDWADSLEAIGIQSSGLKSCFDLTQDVSDEDSITVHLVVGENILDVPPDRYEYDADLNRICFNDVPTQGTQIVVDYL